MLMSEFIGASSSVGVAQQAYVSGISAAWTVGSFGIGFLLYSVLLARKFNQGGENTISGVLARVYGSKVKVASIWPSHHQIACLHRAGWRDLLSGLHLGYVLSGAQFKQSIAATCHFPFMASGSP